MDPPDRLPGDQRAVLQLVLGQRRSYGEIAEMLSIAPDQVRDRARTALDALGPPNAVTDAERGRIADYLLGQLSPGDTDAVRDVLAASPAQRAWARVVSAELRPLATQPLPPIPDGQDAPGHAPATGPDAGGDPATAAAGPGEPRSSRTGGIVLLSLVAAAAIAAIVIFVLKPGGGSHHTDPSTDAGHGSGASLASSPSDGSSSTTTASQSARIVGQITLAPPAGGTRTTGAALVLAQGSLKGLGIEAVHVPPNTTKPHTAYAVWLYNSPTDAKRLGYVNPPVSTNGKLDASTGLPANASHYRLLIITLQTESSGHTSSKPGPVVLEGKLSDVPKSRL